MSETTTTDAGAQAATDGGNQQQTQPRTYTQEEYEAVAGQVKELRGEAAKYRTSAKDLETRLSAFQDGMTKADADKLRAEFSGLSESLTKAQERALASDIRATAKDLGFIDVDVAQAMLDRSLLREKDGEVTGVKEALEKLAKDKPILLGPTGNVDAGARGTTNRAWDGNAALRGALRR